MAVVNGVSLPALPSESFTLGNGLRVVARSLDGLVIEAVVHERFDRYLGVQFHPDYLVLWEPDAPFAVQEGDDAVNFVAQKMREDSASAAFNRGIWELFSAWAHAAR